jgi:hypothetical protein
MEGVYASSNCPDFTAQMKAAKNPMATKRLIKMSRKTIFIKTGFRYPSKLPVQEALTAILMRANVVMLL